MASMESTDEERPTKISANIKNLQRELEELAAKSKPSSCWGRKATGTPPGTIVIRGK